MGDNYFLLTNLLSEDEQKIITSIAAHLERGEKRVGIQQVATENFVSTATIVKMCKRLGFEGYSELYYYLSRQLNGRDERRNAENLKNLIDNYSDTLIDDFCGLLKASRQEKMFTTGAGFSISSAPTSRSGFLSAALWCSIMSISTIICSSRMLITCPAAANPR